MVSKVVLDKDLLLTSSAARSGVDRNVKASVRISASIFVSETRQQETLMNCSNRVFNNEHSSSNKNAEPF